MTSTHMYQGMEKDSKPTSRVLAPPGGGSSNIFGVDSPAPVKQPPKTQPPAQEENILGQPPQNLGDRNIRAAPKQGEPASPKQFKPYKGIETLSLSGSDSEKRLESSRASNKPNAMDSSFNRVFGEFQGDSKSSALKRFTDPSAFNPITGEPYGATPTKSDTKPKAEVQKQDVEEPVNQDATAAKESSSDNSHQKAPSAFPYSEPKEHTSTRVLNPPGGKSSKLW